MLDEKDYKEIGNLFKIIIENEMKPQFNLLAEEIQTIRDLVTPKSEIEELKEEVEFLKSVIRLHAKEINELKKAQ